MTADRVIIVMLRQPRSDKDVRTDPLYEFGSFGLTGCHRGNLLRDDAAAGARLAFAQGGPLGFRLVMLTPPIEVRELAHRREAMWRPAEMPLTYARSPILIDNHGHSDVAGLPALIEHVERESRVAQFASAFRTRKRPLDAVVAANLTRAWTEGAKRFPAASKYWEALPTSPATPDVRRRETFNRLRREAHGESVGRATSAKGNRC